MNIMLNLNAKYLKNSRKEKLTTFFSLSTTNKVVQKDKLKRLLLKDIQMQGNRFSTNFPGMSEYYIKKYGFN